MAINAKDFAKTIASRVQHGGMNDMVTGYHKMKTKANRMSMIDKVAEQKVRKQPNYTSSLPMEMKQKMKMDTAKGLKNKMKAKGVY